MRTTTMQYRLLLLLALWLLGHHGILTSGCLEIEREALLTFKAGIIDTTNRLSSWAGRDCCSWRGVVCDNNTGHVVKLNLQNKYNEQYGNWSYYPLRGEINSSLLVLTHLSSLDLSWNDFGRIPIPKFIGSLKGLMHLDLSDSNFSGKIPSLLALTHLSHLDLSMNDFGGISIPKFIGSLKGLMHLDLSGSNFSGKIPSLLALTHLSHLGLSQNDFGRISIPKFIGSLKGLMHLDLSGSNFTGKIPSLLALTHLSHLDLSMNDFGGISIPKFICSLKGLMHLDLYGSNFSGKIPEQLGNLSNLRYLDLSFLNFICTTPPQLNNLSRLHTFYLVDTFASNNPCVDNLSWLSQLSSIRVLDLSMVNLSNATDWLDVVNTMHFLTELSFSECRLTNIPTSLSHMNFTSLKSFDLSYNLLVGPIPAGIWRVSNLQFLDLSSNFLQGVVSEAHFANLSKLKFLSLHSNSLIIDVDQNWIPPFQLSDLVLDSCQFLHPQFPAWLRSQMQLGFLSLSNTSIADTIPEWFWNLPLYFIDLSYNQIRGKLPMPLQFTNLKYLFLKSNRLEGPIPSLPNTLQILDLSENSISGFLSPISNMSQLSCLLLSSNQINDSIPSYICKLKFLGVLNLSNNSLSGELPQCWKNSNLAILDLSNNNLTGEIPSSIGSLSSLIFLHLNNNNFYGELPLELQHCNNLQLLDLSNNKFTGKIPTWIGENLQDLVILQLRSNMFMGEIPSKIARLAYLQFLDLAHNNLTGTIPHSFGNFSAMIYDTLNYYYESLSMGGRNFDVLVYSNDLLVVTKGEEYQYSTTINLLKVMDLSENNLSGQIPKEIVALVLLDSFNLSGNHLTGTIPERLGDMRSLESLDLSLNDLQGAIPQSLTTLTFLNHLNLSYNNLSGRIPTGNQLSTFNSPSYMGNSYLCGPPTRKSCSENETMPDVVGDNYDGSKSTWPYLGMGLGFTAGFWSVCGILIFKKSWSIAYFQMIDRLYDKIYVILAINMRRLNRKMRG